MPKILYWEEHNGGCKITISGTRKSDIDYVRSVICESEAEDGVVWQLRGALDGTIQLSKACHRDVPLYEETHVFIEDREEHIGHSVLVFKDIGVSMAIARLWQDDNVEMTIQFGRKHLTMTLTRHLGGSITSETKWANEKKVPQQDWGKKLMIGGFAFLFFCGRRRTDPVVDCEPMTPQHDKAKRWRPRFSVRTLVVLVTLVCCYAACWGPTKTQGVVDVRKRSTGLAFETNIGQPVTYAVAPLLVKTDEPFVVETTAGVAVENDHRLLKYYFWFFGYVAKLPYEREQVPRRSFGSSTF